MDMIKKVRSPALVAGFAVMQTAAMAQSSSVTITYGPDVTSVPTLSQWGIVTMSVLLAVAAVIAMRRQSGRKTLMSIALAAVISLGGGGALLKDAVAAIGALYMDNQAGGTITATQGGLTTSLANDTTVRLKVLAISPAAVHNAVGGCVAGVTVLPPGASCTVLTDGSGPLGDN